MSLSQTLAKATYAIPFVFAVATGVANSQALPVIEPSSTDMSKPLAAACVKTTPGQPGLTAIEKLSAIMNARGQMIAVSGDKIVKGSKTFETMFTVSNNFSGKEGYIVDSSTNKTDRMNAEGFCFSPVKTASVEDIVKLAKVPENLNINKLGVALTNNHNLGSKVGVWGTEPNGSLFVVHFNPNTPNKKGTLKGADAQGDHPRDTNVFENMDYSPRMRDFLDRAAAAANNKSASQKLAGLNTPKLEPVN